MNNELFQKHYFKYMHQNNPTLLYNDILLILSEKYHPKKTNILFITKIQ
jgi:hypothetical protein